MPRRYQLFDSGDRIERSHRRNGPAGGAAGAVPGVHCDGGRAADITAIEIEILLFCLPDLQRTNLMHYILSQTDIEVIMQLVSYYNIIS